MAQISCCKNGLNLFNPVCLSKPVGTVLCAQAVLVVSSHGSEDALAGITSSNSSNACRGNLKGLAGQHIHRRVDASRRFCYCTERHGVGVAEEEPAIRQSVRLDLGNALSTSSTPWPAAKLSNFANVSVSTVYLLAVELYHPARRTFSRYTPCLIEQTFESGSKEDRDVHEQRRRLMQKVQRTS